MTEETQPPKTAAPPAPKPASTPAPKPALKITIQNKNLIESILYLKTNNLLPESKSKTKFETVSEAEDEKKEDITDLIREKANTTKQDITELQKAGYNLHLESIKLIAIPLKQKVWLSTLAKKDLENIFKILNEANVIITPMKKENEENIQEKERLEKIADQKEKEAEKVKQKPVENTPQPVQEKTKTTKQPKTKTTPIKSS